MDTNTIIGIVVIVGVLVGAFTLFRSKDEEKVVPQKPSPSPQPAPPPAPEPKPEPDPEPPVEEPDVSLNNVQLKEGPGSRKRVLTGRSTMEGEENFDLVGRDWKYTIRSITRGCVVGTEGGGTNVSDFIELKFSRPSTRVPGEAIVDIECIVRLTDGSTRRATSVMMFEFEDKVEIDFPTWPPENQIP